MRKLLSTCLLVAAALTTQAQLVSSLNFSTGHDNTTGTALPIGVQDPNWRIIGLSAPFIPAGPIPYDSYTQTPWGPGPVTPVNTDWISYDATGMTLSAPPDYTGGSTTYEYHFEMCKQDKITFNATMRSDNRISAVRVDGVTTGYSQPTFTTLNWTSGSAFGYSVTLPAGTHTLEVDVLNAPSGNTTNPTGLNVAGTLSGTGNSIVDRDNYPQYVCCNANFRYCMNTYNPYQVDLSADDPTQPAIYNWYVNGGYVGTGTTLPYSFGGPNTYEVCLRLVYQEGQEGCEKCIKICIAENRDQPAGAGKKETPANTGINMAPQAFELTKVYPNPASAEVNVELKSSIQGTVSMKLYDVMGKVVSEQDVTLSEGQKKVSIATGKLPAGVYSLRISDGATSIVEKVQVVK